MSMVQEHIQGNEHRLTLERQTLAHMEISSLRYLSAIYSALGDVNHQSKQGLSLYERTIGQLKFAISELEEANIILSRLHHDA